MKWFYQQVRRILTPIALASCYPYCCFILISFKRLEKASNRAFFSIDPTNILLFLVKSRHFRLKIITKIKPYSSFKPAYTKTEKVKLSLEQQWIKSLFTTSFSFILMLKVQLLDIILFKCIKTLNEYQTFYSNNTRIKFFKNY